MRSNHDGFDIGINRLFSFDDIVRHYGGPVAFWDAIRHLLPVLCIQDGAPIYLESAVDDCLKVIGLQLQSAVPCGPLPNIQLPGRQAAINEPTFVTVAEAQRRYLGGTRSRRWWYRLVETGRIPHHRVGDSILLKTEDIDHFIAESRKVDDNRPVAEASEAPSPVPPAPPVNPRPRHQPKGERSPFHFFPR